MPKWKTEALRVFSWFLGHNDLSLALVDLETGSCHDGLHPDRVNQNRGGKSVVSYLLVLRKFVSARSKAARESGALRAIVANQLQSRGQGILSQI